MSTFALGPFELVVVILATYRATRLLVKDGIFKPARERVELWSYNQELAGHHWRGRVSELVTCPFCLGVWISWIGFTVAVFALGRYGSVGLWSLFIEAWAVAGGQALLSAVDAFLEQFNKAVTQVVDDDS